MTWTCDWRQISNTLELGTKLFIEGWPLLPRYVLRLKVAFSTSHISWSNNPCSYESTYTSWVAVISAKSHKHQRRKRQYVTAKREKSETPKVLTAILT